MAELDDKFRKLNSNAIAHRERYEYLLQRYSEARVPTSDNPQALEYQVVEAPKTLPDPVAPNRPLLMTLLFIGACALGIGIYSVLSPK